MRWIFTYQPSVPRLSIPIPVPSDRVALLVCVVLDRITPWGWDYAPSRNGL